MQRRLEENVEHRHWMPRALGALLVVLCALCVKAQAEDFQVIGATIFGGSNLLVRTNAAHVQYTSVLSDDKQRLTLTIKNAGIRTEQRDLNSPRGLIESAILQRVGRDVVINLYFRQAAGYTAVLLPYSRSVSVDAFLWNKLSSSEDQYRSGLIALQNNVLGVAKDLFYSAAQAQHPDANAFAGFLSAREGNYTQAKEFFLKALEQKSTLGDIYGGLAQVSRVENNEPKAREYENQFVQRMGRPPYFDEEQLKIQKIVRPVAEPSSLASLNEHSDSAKTAVTDITKATAASADNATDSLMLQLRTMQSGQSANAAASGDSSKSAQQASTASKPLFAWFDSALLGLGAALILVGFVFVRGYSRWKKQQLSHVKEALDQRKKSEAFGSNLQQAMAVSDQQAVNVYKRGAALIDRHDDESVESPDVEKKHLNVGDKATARPKIVDFPSVTASMNTPKEAAKNEDLFDFDESFYASRKPQQKKVPTTTDFEPVSDSKSPLYNTNAEAQLSAADAVQAGPVSGEPIDTNPLLDVDAESLEALASQLGLDPTLLSTVRKRKGTPSSSEKG